MYTKYINRYTIPALNSGEQSGTLYEGIRPKYGESLNDQKRPENIAIVSNKKEVPGSSPGRPTFRNTRFAGKT